MKSHSSPSPDLVYQEILNRISTLPAFDDRLLAWEKNYATKQSPRYATMLHMVELIRNRLPGNRMVDVGAIPGHLSALMQSRGFDVSGVDLDPSRAQAVFDAMGIPLHRADIERDPLPFENNSVDLVVFTEILEHLGHNPIHPIRDIFRILKPGGFLLLSTPNITPAMRWGFLRGKNIQGDLIVETQKRETLGHMGHIRLYTESELRLYLERLGFVVHEVIRGGRASPTKNLVNQLLNFFFKDLSKPTIFVFARKP